ncbi:tyrosine-type recombinase/integrase [uncultured Sphingomonas sp.]|uniref:tyrosine-type recombinase/integrase n=1 Tax=uncultured Sphingomonas sp. TaxID=158754 RepID=UPI00374A7CC9
MLTDLVCRKATPKDRAYKLSDAGGLYLEVLPSGYRSWRLKYRVGKTEKRLVFGSYPEVPLSRARQLRDEAKQLLRDGKDPSIVRKQRAAEQAVRNANTFRSWAEDWISSEAATWSAKHRADVEGRFEKDVYPKIGALPLAEITSPMILAVLRRVESRGAVETSHRIQQRISEVYVRAIVAGAADRNPAADMHKALSRVRRGKQPAVRTVAEAVAVLKAVEARPSHPLVKIASRLLALTAVRPGVLRLADPREFEDLDGPEPIWRVPAEKMKLDVDRKQEKAFEFIVPLSTQAVATVKAAIAFSGGGSVIFRSVRSARKPISDSTLSKAYRDAGYSGKHVPHGWRSTFSTVMNELAGQDRARDALTRIGDRAIIDLMLAHVQDGVEPTYNRAAYMTRRRELAQEWADALTAELDAPETLIDGPRR